MIQLLPLSKPVQTAKDYKAYLTRTLLNRLFKMRMNAWAFENLLIGKPVFSTQVF